MKTIIIAIGILFTGISLFSQSAISYTYDKHGRLTSEEFETVYKIQLQYDQEGNFTSKSVLDYTGITASKDLEITHGYKLYPNPADDKINIEALGKDFLKNIRIYDISGRMVREIEATGYHIVIPVHDLFSSIYVVRIESEGKTDVIKFIKK